MNMLHRHSDWEAIKRWAYPILAAALALVLYVRDARAATSWGVHKQTAFVIYRSGGPLTEFIIKFDLPDIPNPKEWR